MVIKRERKSNFVKLFDKTPPQVVCPHFYELVISNGCPFDCTYCYLKLTFRGNTKPNLFTNGWEKVKRELDVVPKGVFSTGELADSLAIIPPLLPKVIDYFELQKEKYLLLLTKSDNISFLEKRKPSRQIIVSFSVNSLPAAIKFEHKTPSPLLRLKAAKRLKKLGWRVRIRIDPIIQEIGINTYKSICERVVELNPEMTTVGTLRQYPGLFNFSPDAPRKGLRKSEDGRMRYSLEDRIGIYAQMKSWLGFQPALCKETKALWRSLGWRFSGCNCTV
jgi:spore photoproduct lyase